ncbi:hypothetical protein QL285_051897 [Trifolium repens]|nr:hypothetical protein QL285_051897 [Trifolium repens]
MNCCVQTSKQTKETWGLAIARMMADTTRRDDEKAGKGGWHFHINQITEVEKETAEALKGGKIKPNKFKLLREK